MIIKQGRGGGLGGFSVVKTGETRRRREKGLR